MLFRTFLSNRRGNVATFFALSLVPLAGASGMAIDYSRAATLKTELQKAADSSALAVAIAYKKSRTLDVKNTFNKTFAPGVTYSDLKIDGKWVISGKRYRVTASATAPTTMMSVLVPSLDVGVAASAELNVGLEIDLQSASMEPEAGDYNELRVYCFKKGVNGAADQRLGPYNSQGVRETGPIKIADNSPSGIAAGVTHKDKMSCAGDEVLSFQMHNIRDARTASNPYSKPASSQYDYYTDTTESDGKVVFHTAPDKMIETIYCETKEKCTTPKSKGGDIPDRKTNRDPAVNTSSCTKGFMYMGWEDRPPTGSSDRDYDDIRIVMSCHDRSKTAEMEARLVE